MHIDNTYLTNRTVGQPDQPVVTPDAATRAANPPHSASSHVPSPELQDLLVHLRNTPAVRPDVIARIAQRLASGYYQSRAAAEQAAEAILGAQE